MYGIFVRCVVLFLSFFRYPALSFQKEEREGLARDSLVKLQPYCCRGFGRAKPAISVATPPPPPAPSAVGLTPFARHKASKQLVLKSLKGFIGSDWNEAVHNHPANVIQISRYTTEFSSIASSFVFFFILLPFVLKKK